MLKKTLTILAALVLCLAFFVSAAEAACTSTLHPVKRIDVETVFEKEYIDTRCYKVYRATYETWSCDCRKIFFVEMTNRVPVPGITCDD